MAMKIKEYPPWLQKTIIKRWQDYRRCHPNSTDISTIDEAMESTISPCFDFAQTPEGHTFWAEIHWDDKIPEPWLPEQQVNQGEVIYDVY